MLTWQTPTSAKTVQFLTDIDGRSNGNLLCGREKKYTKKNAINFVDFQKNKICFSILPF
jgi:hypothetical protein